MAFFYPVHSVTFSPQILQLYCYSLYSVYNESLLLH